MTNKKRVTFLMSDTGYGHRAAAVAIADALQSRHGDQVECRIIDVFRHYTPFPFRRFPQFYPWMMRRNKRLYGLSYKLSDTPRRARLLGGALHTISRPYIKHLVDDDTDVVVCTHSIITRPSVSAFMRQPDRPPFLTVVVDLISTHMFWYDERCDLFLLPTSTAYEHATRAGLPAHKLLVTGMPVHPHFLANLSSQEQARQSLGWDPDLPAILLVGGGEGMGRLQAVARAINKENLPCQLAVVTGNNHRLRYELEAQTWNQPTHIYGFVHNMYELMSAASVLVTKAGSLTISEACIAGLPMLLYEALPGQEEGNLGYVKTVGAGLYTPSLKTIVSQLRRMLVTEPDLLITCAENARLAARPDAVWQIADIVWERAQHTIAPV